MEDDECQGKQQYFAEQDADLFEEELYGDLSVDLNQEMTYPELKKLYDENKKQLRDVMLENKTLREQNIILKKNISSLYLTAREEIQRKDAQISALHEKEVKMRKTLYAKKTSQDT
ncbi:predicted protein [Nematostella vectensis]|uniref:Uncharacterized protein n=1 Tax=Nematostella vectensis TaxID=45351 RepID=A7SS09_NEMVE|nr:CASP8-associated protein 2 [Nematostella vectensis]EDO33507.1 predicted protein [Nematostella vectensis]|eukprot:XP_001625607.1 predicted protein [Nematostella vectensis]